MATAIDVIGIDVGNIVAVTVVVVVVVKGTPPAVVMTAETMSTTAADDGDAGWLTGVVLGCGCGVTDGGAGDGVVGG